MHEEFYQAELHTPTVKNYDHDMETENNNESIKPKEINNYTTWCLKLLDALDQGIDLGPDEEPIPPIDTQDKSLTKFLIEIPLLLDECLEKVDYLCQTTDKVDLGINTLRDLVSYRPSTRQICLEKLLKYALVSDNQLRTTAVESLMTFIPDHKTLAPKINAFALDTLKRISDSCNKIEQESADEGEISDEPEKLMAQLDLFLNCCSKDFEALKKLFDIFGDLNANLQESLCSSIISFISVIVEKPDQLFELIETFPAGAEELVLSFINSLLLNPELAPKTLESTLKAYQSRELDVRFLVLVIEKMEKSSIMSQLPKLIDSLDESDEQSKIVRSVFIKLVDVSRAESMGEERALITPAELLIKLHNLEVDSKKALMAIKLCLTATDVFKQEVLAIVLQQLSDQVKLPDLYMRTMIQTVAVFPDISNFVMGILQRLVSKKIWKQPVLWEGFIGCITVPPIHLDYISFFYTRFTLSS